MLSSSYPASRWKCGWDQESRHGDHKRGADGGLGLRHAASTLAVIAPNQAFLMLTDRGAATLDGNLEPEAFRIGCAQALQEAEDIRLAWTS
jgi:hypothetical protein